MAECVRWVEVEKRQLAVQQRMHLAGVSPTTAERVRAVSTVNPPPAAARAISFTYPAQHICNVSLSDDDSDISDSDASFRGDTLSDVSPSSSPPPPRTPLPAPPLTALSPPPLFVQGSPCAPRAPPPGQRSSPSLSSNTGVAAAGAPVLASVSTAPSQAAPPPQPQQQQPPHHHPSKKGAKRKNFKRKAGMAKGDGPVRTLHRNPYGTARPPAAYGDAAVCVKTDVELFLLSLRRLDVVRRQRIALEAKTAAASAQLGHQQHQKEAQERRHARPQLSPDATHAVAEAATRATPSNSVRRRHAQLVHQLRLLDRANDDLRRRYAELQQEKHHCLTLREARLRRHGPPSRRAAAAAAAKAAAASSPSVPSTGFDDDVEIRSLSPIRSVSCLSESALPDIITVNTARRPMQQNWLQVEQQLDRRHAAALQRQRELQQSFELAMARERGRQTALAHLRESNTGPQQGGGDGGQ